MCEIVPAERYLLTKVIVVGVVLSATAPLATADFRPDSVPGGVAEVRVAATTAPRPQVQFGNRPVLLQQRHDGWYALVGLPLDTPPGENQVQVETESGVQRQPFQVHDKQYPVQKLTLKNPKMVTPDPADLARIEAERNTQIEVRSRFRDVPITRLDLAQPTEGRLSSRFGLRRVFNGEPRAPHAGLDVAAPAGAAIRAPADGVVTLVDDFYFNGKTVFVDHGQGFVSMVCHLQQADVRVGQPVLRGDPLGRVGSTGRATGPHLHWSVYLNGAAVDPALFIGPPPKH